MYNLFLIIILFSFSISETYSWEDRGSILGYYGNLVGAESVGETDGVVPYDGDYMLTVSEFPFDGTPQAFIGWITDISAGDEITACFYGYDITPASSPSLRIWGSWSANDDINQYAGNADGNEIYTDGSGWNQVCHTFSTSHENWDEGEALVIQARLYSSPFDESSKYFIDLLSIETTSSTATIHFPEPLNGLLADAGDDQTVNEDSLVILDGSGSINTDGDIATYLWEQTAGIAVELDDEEAMTTTFIAPNESTNLGFKLTIYDIDGNEATDSVIITVLASTGDLAISDIQGEFDSSPFAGQFVTTDGYVTGRAEYGFFIQDDEASWSGIWVLDFGSESVNIGDEVEVAGMVEEYYDLTEINITSGTGSVNILSTGNSLYNPLYITQVEEAYESVLVTVSGICDGPPNQYGEWTLSGVWINNLMYSFTPVTGQEYTITGPLNYSYGEYKVEPRDSNDIIEELINDTIGDINYDDTINIYDIILLINLVFDGEYNSQGDINEDGILNIIDCILLVNLILDN